MRNEGDASFAAAQGIVRMLDANAGTNERIAVVVSLKLEVGFGPMSFTKPVGCHQKLLPYGGKTHSAGEGS